MKDLTVNEALDRIPDTVNERAVEIIERLAPTHRVTVAATTGIVLAELYREGLIEFPDAL